MVFEFYGCPGCGKSTVVKATEQILKEAGIGYLNYYDVYYDGNNSAMHRLLNYFKSVFNPSSCALNLHIVRTCMDLKCPFKYAVYLMTMCKRIKDENSRSKNTLILLDEGVIQFITSLSHGKEISTYESVVSLINHIIDAGITLKAVECVLPLNENIKRLTGREQTSRFLDVGEDDELKKLLVEKKKNLDFVASFYEKSITLNMSEDPKKNAKLVSDLILTTLSKSHNYD